VLVRPSSHGGPSVGRGAILCRRDCQSLTGQWGEFNSQEQEWQRLSEWQLDDTLECAEGGALGHVKRRPKGTASHKPRDNKEN
jgi:hypothetical protein